MKVILLFATVLALSHASPTNFITNGIYVPAGFAPYHAHLLIRENADSLTFVGSGVLISVTHVLTTASNTHNYNWWNVGLGSVHRDELEWHETNIAAIHPQFSPFTLDNNLAIITLIQAVVTTASLSPIQMPNPSQSNLPLIHSDGRVTGFGFTSTTGEFASDLKAAFQRVADSETCTTAFPHMTSFANRVFCSELSPNTVCAGDQGSAYAVDVAFRPVLMGICSFASSECDDTHPAVYVRVNEYREWIQDATGIIW